MSEINLELTEALPNLPRKLAIAARYALDNPERIAFDSMRRVATTCNISSPTMLRLARALNYESYDAFRSKFQQSIANQGFGNRADALQNSAKSGETSHLAKMIAQAATQNISQTMAKLDIEVIKAFAKSVQTSQHTFVLGVGSMHWMSALMESTGKMAIHGLRADHSGSATLVETIASITVQDMVLVLAFAPYARETVNAAAYAKKQGAKVFALTDKLSSPLVEYADYVLLAPTQSPHYYPSVISTVMMIEILLSATVAASDTRDRIRQTELVRKLSGAYLL